MPLFDGTGDTAQRGGLALQEKLRAQRAAAARLADYEGALRTVFMLALSQLGTPEDRLEHIRRYVGAVLPAPVKDGAP